MGADGHIYIYDLELLKKEFPEIEQFYGYKYEIFGHTVIVHYYDTEHHDYRCLICGSDWACTDEEKLEKCKIAKWEVWT